VSEFLSPDEIRDLTQRARREGQARALRDAGIPFRQVQRRLIVSRHRARKWLTGRTVASSFEPNMAAIK
jgi:hypothetical protein